MNIVKHVFIYKDFKVETTFDNRISQRHEGVYILRWSEDHQMYLETLLDIKNVLLWLQLNEIGGIEEIRGGSNE